jgi:hypothetical protein
MAQRLELVAQALQLAQLALGLGLGRGHGRERLVGPRVGRALAGREGHGIGHQLGSTNL